MSNMTKNGIAAGLVTAVLVCIITRVGQGNIHDMAFFLSGSGNDGFLLGTNLLLIVWALCGGFIKLIWKILQLNVAVFVIVHIPKLISQYVVLGDWTLRPIGGADGFPSGHATHAFAMAFLLSHFFPRFWLLWYTLAGSIVWSRIEMGAHTPFQLIAGICFGLAIGYGFVHNGMARPSGLLKAKSGTGLPVKISG